MGPVHSEHSVVLVNFRYKQMMFTSVVYTILIFYAPIWSDVAYIYNM